MNSKKIWFMIYECYKVDCTRDWTWNETKKEKLDAFTTKSRRDEKQKSWSNIVRKHSLSIEFKQTE